MPFRKLAIIAGEGRIPLDVAQRATEKGVEVHILAVRGHADPMLYRDLYPTTQIRMGALKSTLALLKEAEIQDLIMVGSVRRPSLMELMPDTMALKVIGQGALKKGDDGLLRTVIQYLEQEQGIRVHALNVVLDDSSPGPGILGDLSPNRSAYDDIKRGQAVLLALADLDVGQAVVVQESLVLGIEGIEGTDALIHRCAALKRQGAGPILVKLRKPGQTDQADLPTLGPDSLHAAIAAGFSGIALEAHGCILVDQERCIADANKAGLFMIALSGDVESALP